MNVSLRTLAALPLVALLSLTGCSKAQDIGGSAKTAAAISGQSTDIIGGTIAVGDEDFAKTVVSLYDTTQGALCTASILSDSILVTAAHCVGSPASSLRVIFGKDLSDRSTRVVRAVVSYETTPLWASRSDQEFNAGDMAIVRFSGGLPEGFQPATVLSDASLLKNGADVLLAGYGIADGVEQTGAGILRSVEVPILNAAYSESEVLIDQHSRKGACHGDSGGPAYVKVGGTWELWGVTNRGVNDPNNDCTVSAAYASIPFYKSWIQKTITKLNAVASSRTRSRSRSVANVR